VTVLVVVAAVAPVGLLLLPGRRGDALPSWLSGIEGDAATTTTRDTGRLLGRAMVAGAAGAAACVTAFAIYTFVWDPVTALATEGWFATTTTAYASQAIAGGVAAVGAAAVVLAVRRAQVPLAGTADGVAAVIGSLGVWAVRSIDSSHFDFGRFDDILVDVLVVSVIGGLAVAALLVLLRCGGLLTGPARALALVLPAVAAIVLVAVGVAALRAQPSYDEDLAHFGTTFEVVRQDVVTTVSGCDGRPVDPAMIEAGRRVQAMLAGPAAIPSRDEVRRLHTALSELVDVCTAGLVAASATGASGVPMGVSVATNERLNAFLALAEDAGILPPV
jgi:hypothetical protein